MTETAQARATIGVIGLAVMGSNLSRNLAHHGYRVAVYNRTTSRTDDLIAQHGSEGDFVPSARLADFVASLERPRRVIIMVQAGKGTDAVIDELIPLLEPGDIVVDGGNANYQDTRRREQLLRGHNLHFVGAGISGGEVGALEGPSIMPGGSKESYEALGPILETISAKAPDGEPCCAYMGPDGAGHYVKMVHNGIEYADMQFIAEAYDLLSAAGFTAAEMAEVFRAWNTGDLDSYLIEITAEVLDQVDQKTGKPLVEVILDAAEQKGTGRWTVQSALEMGVPVNAIAEAVFARSTSGHTELREAGRAALVGPARTLDVDKDTFADQIRSALWASKVVAYAQGLDQIKNASQTYDWGIDVGVVAKIWRAGCIIRAKLLERIRAEYAGGGDNPPATPRPAGGAPSAANQLPTLLAAPSVAQELGEAQDAWRAVVAAAVRGGVPVPGFAAALAYYDTVRAKRLPASLVQGLRDFFGAHTYKRTDAEGSFHTLWSGDRTEISA